MQELALWSRLANLLIVLDGLKESTKHLLMVALVALMVVTVAATKT